MKDIIIDLISRCFWTLNCMLAGVGAYHILFNHAL